MTKLLWCVAVFLGLAVVAAPLTSARADDPKVLKWADLRPAAAAAAPENPAKPKSFFQGAAKPPEHDAAAPPPPPQQDGKFMSMKRRQPGGDKPPVVATDLNGQRVQLGGYIVPLDFEATTIKEFLLVPFVGACIHVPPPPANQIVYVKSEAGIEISGSFDPVTVTGTMKTETAFTGLADAGYTLTADKIDIIKQ